MRICLIMDNPETPRHPVIAVALQELGTRHDVRLLDVRTLSGAAALQEEERHAQADLYLLKSHAPQALEVAQALEQKGALVLNSWASSVACQDRVLMARRMHEAHLPWPRTWHYARLTELVADKAFLEMLSFPVIIKSYYSHRGDLVAFVRGYEELAALAGEWSQEPIVVQEYAESDGWDIKMWVIDGQIFAARRRTPLEPNAPKEDYVIAPHELPQDWAEIAREIGRVFNLRLYGVDLLVTNKGPMIVDVNSFPGFRGVPGADAALVELVDKLGREQSGHATPGRPQGASLPYDEWGVSIMELPDVVRMLFERAGRPLLPGAQETPGLFVRYLRRKPERGLAVIYAVQTSPGGRLKGSQGEHARDPYRSVSLTLDEQALDGAAIRFSEEQAREAALEVQPGGVLRAESIGLSVQAFPADNGLPALADSINISRGTVFSAIELAAQTQLQDDEWRLVRVVAEPVRYKPGNRCVIRYRLTLNSRLDDEQKHLTIFGKVYADPQQARSVQALQQRFYDEQVAKLGSSLAGLTSRTPLLPRPLGIVDEMGLTLNEAVQPAEVGEAMLTGTRALQPRLERGRGGVISAISIPEEELCMTAVALARLHTSAVRPAGGGPRTGAKEAKRARERAALIAGHSPEQADTTRAAAQELASRLELLEPDSYRPAHGGFKSSQLLFHSAQVFVVDFDGFCMADGALDVGYFLAYLRPSGLWYGRPGTREWFEGAAQLFRTTYRQAMLEAGVAPAAIDGILERSRLYEGALIFKIATRRVNRLNSARPQELSAMLDEIVACLA